MAMAKFTVDPSAKLFIAKVGVSAFNVRVDLYSDAIEHWIDDDATRKFTFPLNAVGGVSIDVSAGTSVPSYVFLLHGWRIRPREASHTLEVSGGVILVDGGGDPFVDTLGAYTVRVLYQQPVQAIGVSTGASSAGVDVLVSAVASRANPADVRLFVALHRNGQLVVSPSSATISMKTPSGVVLIPDAAMTGPNADGVFYRDVTGVSLAHLTNYYCDVTVVDAVGAVRQVGVTPTIGG
jgi:hypothetical protein